MIDENDTLKKKVNDSWKESVEKEKMSADSDGVREKNKGDASEWPDITFGVIISGFMMEALVALGDVEHPVSKKKEPDIRHAKFIIDTLGVLKEKTKGNLSEDESGALDSILYDLRMRFLNKQNSGDRGR